MAVSKVTTFKESFLKPSITSSDSNTYTTKKQRVNISSTIKQVLFTHETKDSIGRVTK